MKCTILHDLPGRLRVHLCCGRMTLRQADVLEYYLRAVDGVKSVKVYDPGCNCSVFCGAGMRHPGIGEIFL